MNGTPVIAGIRATELAPAEAAAIASAQPAGFILAAANIADPAQTRALTDSLRALCRRQPAIAVDFAAAPLAGLGVGDAISRPAHLLGDLLRLLGINLHLGPDLGPGTAWGGDPLRVIDGASQWNRMLRKRGIAAAAGPFPASAPSAETLAGLLRGPLTPFTALMPELDALLLSPAVFAGLDPAAPACHSPRIARALARDQLGFDHYPLIAPVSGAPDKAARSARLALEADADLILAADPALLDPVASALAAASHQLIHQAWERIERLRDCLHWPSAWSAAACADTLAKLDARTN